ncbi:AbrB/MazE/SpoVT family DNA-binding domain-containing protein [Paenibacillus herberti]|uniref:AbrB/MazE/SpoVT family DNA-binding domain-containing protein n=1 Tax=Paenibacillus herberti TaxID=1619309 RepID=UPI00159635F9|nr:AbrB/MazE/SpoVT family DNA-binding domain-containing protein [Paenibacillus herberti]
MTIPAEPIAKGTIRTWGNSLALRIPVEVSKVAKLNEGTEIGFHVADNGELVLRPAFPASNDQQSLRELFLSLRGSSKSDVRSHGDVEEPMGDEII